MAMNVLVDFWQKELDAATAAAASALAEQKTCTDELKLARDALIQVARDIDVRTSSLRVLRVELDKAASSAEREAKAAAVTVASIELRRLQGRKLAAEAEVAQREEALAAASDRMLRSGSRKAAAAAALAGATANAKRRGDVRKRLTDPPIGGLVVAATAALAGQARKDADALIKDNFPAELLDLAKHRVDARLAWLDGRAAAPDLFRDALTGAIVADAATEGSLAKARAALEQADSAADAFAAGGKARFDAATDVIGRLAAQKAKLGSGGPDVLTAIEKAAVDATAERKDAATEAAKVADAFKEVADAEADYELELATRAAADPDAYPTQAELVAKRDALAAKRTALATAATDFDATDGRKQLDDWQAAIPDAAWTTLLDYYGAIRTLEEIAAIGAAGPKKLANDAAAREADLLVTLKAAVKASRRNLVLKDLLASREKREASAEAGSATLLLSALRGDTY